MLHFFAAGTWIVPAIVWAAGCAGSVSWPLFFPSRQITLCCRLSLLVVGGKPTFANTLQCLGPLLDFLSDLILAVTFNLTWMVLLWSTEPHAPLIAVLLQFDGSRFHLGRKGEGWYKLSISVSCSRLSLSAMHSCCLAGSEPFHFFFTYPFHLTSPCAWVPDLYLVH